MIRWKEARRSISHSLETWKALAWDVTVSDRYVASHIGETAENAGAAANKAATYKIAKYNSLATTHHFIPIAIETAGPWNSEASEFIAELDKKITEVTLEPLEMQYLFQWLSIALQRGNEIVLRNKFITNKFCAREYGISDNPPDVTIFSLQALCWRA